MAASRDDIKGWFERGKEQGATHMIVACDTYDHSDYPSYVSPGEDVREQEQRLNGQPMTRVMEVYSFSMDMEAQLNEHRAFNYN